MKNIDRETLIIDKVLSILFPDNSTENQQKDSYI